MMKWQLAGRQSGLAMPITDISVSDIADFADGYEFGAVGAYVRIKGVARGELDPAASENAGIVDLDKAPRNSRGLVEYATDFDIMRPKDPLRGSSILVYDVPNRGAKRIFNLLDDVAPSDPGRNNDPQTREDAGLGFLLGRGHSIVWSGWDPGAPRVNHLLAADFPAVLENGKPVSGRIRDEFHFGTRAPGDGSVRRLSYAATSTDKTGSRLTVRDRESDARRDIPPEEWEFVDERSIRLLPVGSKFEPIKIYEFWYEATGARVLGIGFASVRDLVSFFRYRSANRGGVPNPLIAGMSEIRHALAFGVSQSGRFLRHFLELGMNRDETGQRVFDGVMSHVAGAGKVFANHRFGMPGRTATHHEDRLYPENWFPFSTAQTADPVSGRIAGLLSGASSDPKIIETNSATEYWQKGASLIHTDPGLRRDLKLPDNSRAYLIAATQHGGRPGVNPAPGPCVNPRNWHSATPALRALFVALEEWVTKDVPPPPSRVPSLAADTAIPAEQIAMPKVPGFAVAPGDNPVLPPVDWIDPPEASPPAPYATFVSAVDSDGNETAGILLPQIAAPLGTHTGWNVYRAQPDELADRDGSLIPFARTRTEREAAGDPRPSLDERYGTREAYVARVEAAAAALVAERLLLPEDAAAYVAAARACDRF
jgi:alpha/beta hydrolase family protein